jgi:hypothetical protein
MRFYTDSIDLRSSSATQVTAPRCSAGASIIQFPSPVTRRHHHQTPPSTAVAFAAHLRGLNVQAVEATGSCVCVRVLPK